MELTIQDRLTQAEAEHQHHTADLADVEKVLAAFPDSPALVAQKITLKRTLRDLSRQIDAFKAHLNKPDGIQP